MISEQNRIDGGKKARFPAKVGARVLAVDFVDPPAGARGVCSNPPENGFGAGLNEWYGGNPAVGSPAGPGETASRRKIFKCRAPDVASEESCATKILSTLARRAYRRPVSSGEIDVLLSFYQAGRKDGNFEARLRLRR